MCRNDSREDISMYVRTKTCKSRQIMRSLKLIRGLSRRDTSSPPEMRVFLRYKIFRNRLEIFEKRTHTISPTLDPSLEKHNERVE